MSKAGQAAILCSLLAGSLVALQNAGVCQVRMPATSNVRHATRSALDPTRAPRRAGVLAPSEFYQQEGVSWSTRAIYPDSGVYRGLAGAWERQADSSFLYAIGGEGLRDVKACYRYNSRTDAWTRIADLPVASSNQSAVYWQDDGGGTDSSGVYTLGYCYTDTILPYQLIYGGNVYHWTKAANAWTEVTPLPVSSYGNMGATLGDSIFCICNFGNSMYVYSIRQGTWSERPAPATGNCNYGAMAVCQGKVYEIGGFFTNDCFQVYDPVAHTWTNLAAPPSCVGGNAPCFAPWHHGSTERLYCWGGADTWTVNNGVAWWNPATSAWTEEGTISRAVCSAFYGPIAEWPGPVEGLNHACGYNGISWYFMRHWRGIPDTTNNDRRRPIRALRS
jgi:hypothetical protein